MNDSDQVITYTSTMKDKVKTIIDEKLPNIYIDLAALEDLRKTIDLLNDNDCQQFANSLNIQPLHLIELLEAGIREEYDTLNNNIKYYENQLKKLQE